MAQIFVSLGSNIDREFHIRAAVRELAAVFGPLILSSVYESEAVGFQGDAFLNMVIGAHTTLPVDAVVATFKQIEDRYGRVRDGIKYCGRNLDLDLLLYDAMCCNSPIELPRAEILQNAFVLWPLAEIAPQLCHPVNGQTFQQLWQAYDRDQRLWPLSFEF
jgi:2-amino-4-hydroxy-6-hydroxymethyldihydropteridine diphosphokinase